MEQYKIFKVTLRVIDRDGGVGAVAKWTIEYEKLNEGIPDPTYYLDLVSKVSKDAHDVVLPP